VAPQRVLEAHHRHEMRLAPPIFVTVSWLVGHHTAVDAIDTLGRQSPLTFRPRVCSTADGGCVLYPGDAGYEDGDVERPGPRHRLWVLPDGWRYERGWLLQVPETLALVFELDAPNSLLQAIEKRSVHYRLRIFLPAGCSRLRYVPAAFPKDTHEYPPSAAHACCAVFTSHGGRLLTDSIHLRHENVYVAFFSHRAILILTP
jgi:hypothetical protein